MAKVCFRKGAWSPFLESSSVQGSQALSQFRVCIIESAPHLLLFIKGISKEEASRTTFTETGQSRLHRISWLFHCRSPDVTTLQLLLLCLYNCNILDEGRGLRGLRCPD